MIYDDKPGVPWFEGTRDMGGWLLTMGQGPSNRVLAELADAGPIAVDLEGEGLKPPASDRLHCVGVGTAEHVVVADPRDRVQFEALRAAFLRAPRLDMHNSAFDAPILHRVGVLPLDCVDKITDTLIYARAALPERTASKKLADLAVSILGREKGADLLMRAAKTEGITKSQLFTRYDIDRPLYVEGNALDVISTALLIEPLRRRLLERLTFGHPFTEWGVTGEEAARLVEREQVINRWGLRQSCVGLEVDYNFADEFADRNDAALSEAARLLEGVGVSPGDSASAVALMDTLGVVPGPQRHPRLKNGKPSGAKKYLERINHPVMELFLRHKEQSKIQNDYLTKMRDLSVNGRIHPSVNILGASSSGRMSYSGFPIQQLPEGARGMILLPESESIDWAQIEPVVAANLAGDSAVLGPYERGEEKIYDTVGRMAGVGYKPAKVVLLAGMYGQGIPLLSSNLNVSEDEARTVQANVRAGMPTTFGFFDSIKQMARQHRLVPTVSGRILTVPMQKNDDGDYRVATHMAVNYLIQGSAYDLLAEVIWTCYQLGIHPGVYLAMHDELVVNKAVAEIVQMLMAAPPAALIRRAGRIPVLRTDRASLGTRWASV